MSKTIAQLEAKIESLKLALIHAHIDIEEAEDSPADHLVAQEIFYGRNTGEMLMRFMEEKYGLIVDDSDEH